MRINPDELHCADPDMLDEIYAGGNRAREKWEHYTGFMLGPLSKAGFATISYDIHRVRKGAMARYFSRAQMLKLEDEICGFTVRTVDKMLLRAGGADFDVKEVFNCHTADIISQYCFGQSMGFTDQKGFEPNFGTWVKYICIAFLTYQLQKELMGLLADHSSKPATWSDTWLEMYLASALLPTRLLILPTTWVKICAGCTTSRRCKFPATSTGQSPTRKTEEFSLSCWPRRFSLSRTSLSSDLPVKVLLCLWLVQKPLR